jgi:hypothetical protein
VDRPGVGVGPIDIAATLVGTAALVKRYHESLPSSSHRFESDRPLSSDASRKLSLVKTRERAEARRLRSLGWSVREIERHLGVSRSSASLWVRDVPLTDEQIAALHRRSATSPGQLAGAAANAALGRKRRRRAQHRGRTRAQMIDELHLAGCMLYWAEGDKGRQGVRIANSDPALLRLFVRFLRECYGAEVGRIAVSCNLFADHVKRQRLFEVQPKEAEEQASLRDLQGRLTTTRRPSNRSTARFRNTPASSAPSGSASRPALPGRLSPACVDGRSHLAPPARSGRRRPSPTSPDRKLCASRRATVLPPP